MMMMVCKVVMHNISCILKLHFVSWNETLRAFADLDSQQGPL